MTYPKWQCKSTWKTFVILRAELNEVRWAKEKLKILFKLTDLRDLNYYLRASFKRIGSTMFLMQPAYCSSILKQFGMGIEKTLSSLAVESIEELLPQPVSSKLKHKERKAPPYKCPIGSLLDLGTHTQQDITIAVDILSKLVESPTTAHWMAVRRVLGYRQGAQETGITSRAITSRSRMPIWQLYKAVSVLHGNWVEDIRIRKSTRAHTIQSQQLVAHLAFV